MELTKRQINRYIRTNIFEKEYIKTLVEKRDSEIWFLEENPRTSDYPYRIYTNKGYDDELTFWGYCEIVGVKTKGEARELAKDYQIWASEQCLSYSELFGYTELFTKLGKRYGLLKEFRENGIL